MSIANLLRTTLMWIAILAAPSHVFAQSTIADLLELDLEDLANYSIAAPTKTKISLSDAPGAVSLITYDQIQNSSARTIPELLRMVPGITVRWNPMVQTIDARSFGSNPFTSRVLLLIDGVPYNSWNKGGFPQHPGFDFFSLENVKHLEIVRGPGSALYGENALSAVINIVTLSGREFPQTSIKAFGGDRETRSFSLAHGRRLGPDGSIFASVRTEQSQLPTLLWNELNDSSAKGHDIYVKGEYKDWIMSFYRRKDRFDGFVDAVEAPGLPPNTVFRSAEKISQTIDIVAVAYDHIAESKKWSVKVNASNASRDGSHCAGCHSPFGTTAEPEDFTASEDHGYQSFAELQFGLHNIQNHELLFGAEYRKISAGDHKHELSEQDEDVTTYNKTALFVQDQISALDGLLDIIVGLRYDGQTSPRLFDSGLFPRVALVSRPTDKLTLRASWAEAARYPSFTELYLNTPFLVADSPNVRFALADFAPNPNLQPEEIVSTEFGIAYQFSPKLRGRVDFFQNSIRNSISIAYPLIRFENHPNDARIRGLEAVLQHRQSRRWSSFFNWSYQDNEQSGKGTDSSGNRIEFTYSPRHKVNLGATFSPTDALSGSLELSWRDEYTGPAFWYGIVFPADPTPRPLDDYALVNLSLRYKMPFVVDGSKRPLTVRFSGKNLLNKRPFETLTGVGGQITGREFYVGIEYDWTQ